VLDKLIEWPPAIRYVYKCKSYTVEEIHKYSLLRLVFNKRFTKNKKTGLNCPTTINKIFKILGTLFFFNRHFKFKFRKKWTSIKIKNKYFDYFIGIQKL